MTIDSSILVDLLSLSSTRALEAAARTAVLAHPSHRAAIMLRVAYNLTQAAASMYALDRNLERASDVASFADLSNPETLRCFHAICAAWSHAPDAEAMDRAMAAALNAEAVYPEGDR